MLTLQTSIEKWNIWFFVISYHRPIHHIRSWRW